MGLPCFSLELRPCLSGHLWVQLWLLGVETCRPKLGLDLKEADTSSLRHSCLGSCCSVSAVTMQIRTVALVVNGLGG